MVFSPLCYATFQCNRYNKYFFAHENIKKCSQKQQYFTVQSKIFSTTNRPKTSKNIKFGFHKNGSPGDLCIMNFHTGTTRLGSACQLGHREDSGKKTKKLQMSKGIKVLSILEFQMEHYIFCPKDYLFCRMSWGLLYLQTILPKQSCEPASSIVKVEVFREGHKI